jgi:hypothetical protein
VSGGWGHACATRSRLINAHGTPKKRQIAATRYGVSGRSLRFQKNGYVGNRQETCGVDKHAAVRLHTLQSQGKLETYCCSNTATHLSGEAVGGRFRMLSIRRGWFLFALATLAAPCATGGVLISRSANSLQFSEASAVDVNNKDKVLVLGPEAKLTGPVGKLQGVRLEGTLLFDLRQGVVTMYSTQTVEYIFPEGLPKDSGNPATAWKSSKISYKKTASDKNPTEIDATSFVAFLPGGVGEVVSLCNDDRALRLIGSSDNPFAARMELMSAAVKAFPGDAALAPLETSVTTLLQVAYGRFETGITNRGLIDEALDLVKLSLAVYPEQPAQKKLRDQITERKAWLDRRLAVLQAFAGAAEWDPFILGDRDIEQYHQAFPEVATLHSQALKASLESHRQSGEMLLNEKEYEAAWRAFLVASSRQPSDKILQQKVRISWANYSQEVAIDKKGQRKQLNLGERDAMNQALQFATGYLNLKKFDAAKNSVLEAEKIDPDSLPVLLKKAEILGALRQFDEAFATLDRYDLRAVDEEREKASTLRNDLLFERTSSVEDLKAQVSKLWTEGSYHKARETSVQGLQAMGNDAELLYRAAISSMVTRDSDGARVLLTRYLNVSNTLDDDAVQRERVRALLATIQQAGTPETGEANWMSGRKLPANVYYCPTSLAFQAPVDHIEAEKMKVQFEWNGDRIAAINPSFDKPEHTTAEKKIVFAYDDRFPQINFASDNDAARKPSTTDPDDLYKHSSLVLANNPYVDPAAIATLAGKNVALGIAGNSFFEPFVWDRVHYFSLEYDQNGRVTRARELAGGQPGDVTLEFEWNSLQLAAIRGYKGTDVKQRTKIYDRTLQYQEGRLSSEEIQSQGKTSRIKYTYMNGRLVSAECDKDATLDDRSRRVTFR